LSSFLSSRFLGVTINHTGLHRGNTGPHWAHTRPDARTGPEMTYYFTSMTN